MIAWYVHHVGRGHAARAAAVARHLRHDVVGLGSGPAPRPWPGAWEPLERDDLGAAPADVTARGTLHWVPRHDRGLADRSARIVERLTTLRPALVVVDVSVEVALLARLCGIPVVVVALPGDRDDRVHGLAYEAAEALLAPWPPGTHDVSWPDRLRERTWAVGAFGRLDGMPVRPTSRGPVGRVLLLWGGGGRSTTDADVAAARAATPGWEWTECSGDDPADVVHDRLAAADVVVTHGGQNAVAEVAAARRPAVVVAQERPFDEQRATARVVDRMGIAVGLEAWPDAAEWPDVLRRAEARGGEGWAAWSSGTGALEAATRLDALAEERSPVRVPEAAR
ncbi:hypothetical protein KC207_00560 [Phycicoccus sp. BSK3Z-2]|uniref:Glycosyl transferase family 28 C-terminal domain-containing protein n=1 Tax=Phycicoccus avicenniae TaxID=2828860 RepID=A0A941HZ21_9MICO|nr:glycosyltransferase [Phycicoccus avicenniae]MBR7741786.1 hypothetical protein [Phycicoccus avicenniae]